jgi:hypothetical protein
MSRTLHVRPPRTADAAWAQVIRIDRKTYRQEGAKRAKRSFDRRIAILEGLDSIDEPLVGAERKSDTTPVIHLHIDPDGEYGVSLVHPSGYVEHHSDLSALYEDSPPAVYVAGCIAYEANSRSMKPARFFALAAALGYPIFHF